MAYRGGDESQKSTESSFHTIVVCLAVNTQRGRVAAALSLASCTYKATLSLVKSFVTHVISALHFCLRVTALLLTVSGRTVSAAREGVGINSSQRKLPLHGS